MHSINSLSRSEKRQPSSSRELMAREEVSASSFLMEQGDGLWNPTLTSRESTWGRVGGKTIHINTRVSPKINDVSVKLELARDYLVLLRPNEESMKVIAAGDYVPVWDAPHGEEVIAIVKLK